MSERLISDPDQIAMFVDTLFKHATRNTWASLRCFYNDKAASGAGLPFTIEAVRVDDLNTLIDRACLYATRCANHRLGVVFAPPVATFKSSTKATTENLADLLVLSVECDGRASEAVRKLAAIIGAPTIVIASGGTWVDQETGEVGDKLHAHWRLTRSATSGEDHAKAQRARRIMRDIAGSDGTAVPAVHPLRWPGSWHRKDIARPRKACIVAHDELAEVDLETALAKLEKTATARDIGPEQKRRPNPQKMAAIEDIRMWMRWIPNPHPLIPAADREKQWDWWNTIGMALHAATNGSNEGLEIFQRWSAKNARDLSKEDRRFEARWRHWDKWPATKLGAGTLCFWFNEFWSDASVDDWSEDDHAA